MIVCKFKVEEKNINTKLLVEKEKKLNLSAMNTYSPRIFYIEYLGTMGSIELTLGYESL